MAVALHVHRLLLDIGAFVSASSWPGAHRSAAHLHGFSLKMEVPCGGNYPNRMDGSFQMVTLIKLIVMRNPTKMDDLPPVIIHFDGIFQL